MANMKTALLILTATALCSLNACKSKMHEERIKNNASVSVRAVPYQYIEHFDDALDQLRGKNGPFTYTFNEGRFKGTTIKGNFKDGMNDGTWNIYYSNGKLAKTITYSKNQRHGKLVYYKPDGTKRYEGNYFKGKPTGKWIVWDTFENDPDFKERWDQVNPGVNIKGDRIVYINPKRHKFGEVFYNDGKLDYSKSFYLNGLVSCAQYYTDNKIDSMCTWDEQGIVTFKRYWNDPSKNYSRTKSGKTYLPN